MATPHHPDWACPSEGGGATDGEGEGDRLLKKPRWRADGDATQGERRSLKGEQQGSQRGSHVNLPTALQTQPTRYLGDPQGVDE